jgi:hypothetical protein
VDKNGNTLIPFKYSSASDFFHGIAYVSTSKFRSGGYNSSTHRGLTMNGWTTVTTTYTKTSPDYYKTKDFYINRKGKKLKYTPAKGYYSEGLWVVYKRQHNTPLYGYMDESGKVVISPVYRSASNFSEELAMVQTNNNWIIIDKKGKKIADIDLN